MSSQPSSEDPLHNSPAPESSSTNLGERGGKSDETCSHSIAVIGNPNTGKSTLFNALAGMNARVGNYPGVTVEKKLGKFRHNDCSYTLIDLPGTYSLSPRTADEMVSVRVLLGTQKQSDRPDAVMCVVDATRLERNLYLLSQILEIGRPTVLVLNMWDEVERNEIQIDVEELQKRLGIKVVPISARKRTGLSELKTALVEAVNQQEDSVEIPEVFPEEFQQARKQIQSLVEAKTGKELPLFLAERLLLDIGGEQEREILELDPSFENQLRETRSNLGEKGCPVPTVEPRVRYQWIKSVLDGLVIQGEAKPDGFQERLDSWLTHKVTGPLFFAAVMLLMFQSIYSWADPLMGLIEAGQEWAGSIVEAQLGPGSLRSLLVDGVVGGVGSVLVFLPQIVLLFLFIAILEDCGYMSRAAYLMDRVMMRVGLSGKSFVPLMSSYACAIPGLMATRTIEDRRDRFVTMLIAPLMSCSARLPVYLLMINAFIPNDHVLLGWGSTRGFVLFGFYLLGAVIAVPISWILRKTWFAGEPAPFVMELPKFKFPSFRVVFARVFESAKSFVMRAGSLIFLTTILVWAAGYFPADQSQLHAIDTQLEQGEIEEDSKEWEQLSEQRNALSSELLEKSFLGQMGHAIEPVVRPLGWDWRIGVGVLASFPAREVVVGTLGTIFSLGAETDEEDAGLRERLQRAKRKDGSPLFTVPVAFSVMVFFALCAQCAATFLVMARETNSWQWPLFAFTYMTALAYLGAMFAYQFGTYLVGS